MSNTKNTFCQLLGAFADILESGLKASDENIKKQYSELNEEDKKEVVDSANNIIKDVMKSLGVKNYEHYYVKDEDLNNGTLVKSIILPESDSEETKKEKEILKNSEGFEQLQKYIDLNNPSDFTPFTEIEKSAIDQKPSDLSELSQELKHPADSIRKAYDINGNLIEGANPYVSTPIKKTAIQNFLDKCSNEQDISNKINGFIKKNNNSEKVDPMNVTKPLTMEKFDLKNTLKDALKDEYKKHLSTKIDVDATVANIVGNIVKQLLDKQTHSYTFIDDEKYPAVLVKVSDVNSIIKNRVDILTLIEDNLKNTYSFSDVHTNIEDTENKELINLNYYIILD